MAETELLKARIHADMKDAMRAKDSLRLTTIRMLMAAIKQREIDEQTTLNDTQILTSVNKMIKQRRESAEQYQAADRQELADKELAEIKILTDYLPEQLSDAEILAAVTEAIAAVSAENLKDIGKVMGILKPKLHGKADMAAVSKLIRDKLQN
jgi:uncharacterized protein